MQFVVAWPNRKDLWDRYITNPAPNGTPLDNSSLQHAYDIVSDVTGGMLAAMAIQSRRCEPRLSPWFRPRDTGH